MVTLLDSTHVLERTWQDSHDTGLTAIMKKQAFIGQGKHIIFPTTRLEHHLCSLN
jgi:hypothetical protein